MWSANWRVIFSAFAVAFSLVLVPLASAQTQYGYGSTTRPQVRGGAAIEYHSSEYGKPFLAEQEEQKKREAEEAKVAQQRKEEDAKLNEFQRQQHLQEMYANDPTHGQPTPIPKANAGTLAAEQARADEVARLIEQGRTSEKKGPSSQFLETEARFNDAHKRANRPSQIELVASGKEAMTQNEGPSAAAKPKSMTAEQQELLKLELAECQRSGRTPDQLTPAEIAALKAKAGIRP